MVSEQDLEGRGRGEGQEATREPLKKCLSINLFHDEFSTVIFLIACTWNNHVLKRSVIEGHFHFMIAEGIIVWTFMI